MQGSRVVGQGKDRISLTVGQAPQGINKHDVLRELPSTIHERFQRSCCCCSLFLSLGTLDFSSTKVPGFPSSFSWNGKTRFCYWEIY